jgi:hypothetical protein
MNERRTEHDSDALRLLDRFMRIPQMTPGSGWPSTAELQAERVYGLRPVNRIGDLKKGKYNGHCYDFEMISCGRGENRWRLHWPNRPGYPKHKNQVVLPLTNSGAPPADRPATSIESPYMVRLKKEQAAAMPLFGARP